MSTPEVAQAGFVLGAVGRTAMAVIFAQSGVQALLDLDRHKGVLADYRLLPAGVVALAAWALPLLCVATAAALAGPALAPVGVALGCGLLLLFMAAIGVNLARGRNQIECGCGGPGQPISWALVGRNLVMVALLAACGAAPVRGGLNAVSLLTVIGGAGGLVALYFAASQLLANGAHLRQADAA